MTDMLAAVYRRFGGPSVITVERMPRPTPGPGEVLVAVRAASVSIADYRVRSRDVPRGLTLPVTLALGWRRPEHPVLGMDAAGVVDEVGSGVTGFAPGDRVVLLRGATFGCHAQYVTMNAAGDIARIPDSMSFEDAAALPFGFATAVSYFAAAPPAPGMSVLVNGASGAVGSAAVQVSAKAGASVTAVTSARNAELVRELGATTVVDYTREDFADAGRIHDVLVDCVGNAQHRRAVTALRPGGTLLLVITDLPGMIGTKLRCRRDGIRRVDTGEKISGEMLAGIVDRAAAGELRPVIDREYDLADIRVAHEYVDTGRKRGTVLVRMP